jgi:2-phosphoglycerate kinase
LLRGERSLVVLLGGTSGTGKSTLSSLLASRLGISTVLSTDSIRHIMRNFIDREENPILFASTYETGSLVKTEGMDDKKASVIGHNV